MDTPYFENGQILTAQELNVLSALTSSVTLSKKTKSRVAIQCNNLPAGSYYIQAETRNRLNRRVAGPWNKIESDSLGYATLKLVQENPTQYPIPNWMQNGGYLQGRWDFTIDENGSDYEIIIDVPVWLLDLLAPNGNNQFTTTTAQARILGLQRNRGYAQLPFKFKLYKIVDNKDILFKTCDETLGVSGFVRRDDVDNNYLNALSSAQVHLTTRNTANPGDSIVVIDNPFVKIIY